MNITVTLFAQMLAFALLIWFVNKVLWKPMSGMLDDRAKRIADGLAAAEKGKKEQELAEKRVVEVISEAKKQASDIVAQAQKRASEIVEEAKDKAREEADRVKASATAELEQEVNRAKEHLRKEVAQVAAIGASRILKKEIDAGKHADILNDLAAQI
ncbi:MAG: F0F1 ATP synthase subunit B [Gammaproteobacteria bacterium]|nr:F0F1 ATP synthase subunit B [Gammaproteobacteria bacterium]MDH5730535.1 F0F1 ATP synthase subunit B [Gammaproteobacteria bacterium]